MKIVEKKLTAIKAYEKNPRNNDGAVQAVAASIREFGFKVPIVVDKDGVIVAGHTRARAAKILGLEKVPCIVADDLTDEQIRAFRLADNKVSELATWDEILLDDELAEIDTIDMSDFGFIIDDEDELDPEDDKPNQRERTNNAYNLAQFDPQRAAGFYQMPVIKKCTHVPEDLLCFKNLLTATRRDCGIHFFTDDYRFERIWNEPETYIEKMMEFDCALTPDFSLYMDMPIAMKVWNIYRSRLIGQMMQDRGIKVIPTLSWAEPETYQFCFDGLEPGGTVAVSTVGVMKDPEATKIWKQGMNEALTRLRPKTVICYGTEMQDYDFRGSTVKRFDAKQLDDLE